MQTVDFFPPIVDDPRWFGRIAAANSLSDVYAMGGKPLTAMNIVGWPKELDIQILGEILQGGLEKVNEAGAVLCGGHSVTDHEVKFGLSVTGIVHPDRFWPNSGARVGDLLILTKPLGMGPVATAIKRQLASPELAMAAMQLMATLNKAACEAVLDLPVHAATDVTGFGLMGHSCEMAEGAGLQLRLGAASCRCSPARWNWCALAWCRAAAAAARRTWSTRRASTSRSTRRWSTWCSTPRPRAGCCWRWPETAVPQALQRLRDAGAPCAVVVGSFAARGPAHRSWCCSRRHRGRG